MTTAHINPIINSRIDTPGLSSSRSLVDIYTMSHAGFEGFTMPFYVSMCGQAGGNRSQVCHHSDHVFSSESWQGCY